MTERDDFRKEIDTFNTSQRTTARRIFENLQIDGLKPPYRQVTKFLSKIKSSLNGPRAPRHS